MILGIRSNTAEASVVLGSIVEGKWALKDRLDWTAGRQLTDTLHTKIEELLKRNSSDWQDLTCVIVYKGPGSFTGLRIGITVANSAAYGLNIPVVGATGDDWLEQGAKQIDNDHFVSIVMPEYGAEANVTKPKK